MKLDPELVDRSRSQLLVIDVQERLVPVLNDAQMMVDRCRRLLIGAELIGIPISICEQYPEGLGSTVAAVSEVANTGKCFQKDTFSAARAESVLKHHEAEKARGRSQLILAGCEAHVCVLQTAIEMQSAGFEIFVAWDATASRFPNDKNLAEQRLREAGCSLVSTEMILFEWLENSDHKAFKSVSTLLKSAKN